jgi:DNA-binding Xre family transcriptional regulator
MIRVNINRICFLSRVTTAYQLAKLCGFTPTLAYSLFNETFKQISLETLDKLCEGLECQPSDLLVYLPPITLTGGPKC